MQALGLIETIGLTGAVEAADVMLKTAWVRLLELSRVEAGLVTITVAGDVSSVQAAVEAAQAAVRRLPGAVLVSAHVIPRPDEELTAILELDPDRTVPPTPASVEKRVEIATGEPAGTQSVADTAAPEESNSSAGTAAESPTSAAKAGDSGAAPAPEAPRTSVATPGEEAPAAETPVPIHEESALKQMSLGNLRALARSIGAVPHGKSVSAAGKKALIAAILKAQGKPEE